MNKKLFIYVVFVSLFASNALPTTITNKGGTISRVIVTYKEDGCKTNSKELKPDESLKVNQTCKRDTIEATGAGGYSKILATGGYNEAGEIINFEFNQKL